MQLISDIINELVDTSKPVSSVLLKTKLLASRLRINELSNWATDELSGYSDESNVPNYRRFTSNIVGSYVLGSMHYKNAPIPIPFEDEKLRKNMTSFNMKDSITTLETMSQNATSGSISVRFPDNAIRLWEDTLRQMGNPHFQIIEVHKSLPMSSIIEIVSVVRAKLLDFMLKIDEQFGGITELELKEKKNQIATIMSQTIINNTGDGNIVNTGSDAKIKADIKIFKGDRKSLSDKLISAGVTNDDTNELLLIVDEDAPINGVFSDKVNSWIKKMLSKAVEGTWQIGIGAAGGILAESLGKYYGL
ncbi:MAG: hypothetical protein K0S53_664 [Bacteroidetes bacterium]|jgi:hypothetical protein|nr:hypothetical protein [Bacteroidota bacterium]